LCWFFFQEVEFVLNFNFYLDFLGAVTAANMLPDLDDMTPFTIFIPINDAFKALDYAAISADQNTLRRKH
jgi:uncharacterized surface protein with fasciclin (FAS1) repeats